LLVCQLSIELFWLTLLALLRLLLLWESWGCLLGSLLFLEQVADQGLYGAGEAVLLA
jgi:hypothetical protein